MHARGPHLFSIESNNEKGKIVHTLFRNHDILRKRQGPGGVFRAREQVVCFRKSVNGEERGVSGENMKYICIVGKKQ
jgi:hypothetical protein